MRKSPPSLVPEQAGGMSWKLLQERGRLQKVDDAASPRTVTTVKERTMAGLGKELTLPLSLIERDPHRRKGHDQSFRWESIKRDDTVYQRQHSGPSLGIVGTLQETV